MKTLITLFSLFLIVSCNCKDKKCSSAATSDSTAVSKCCDNDSIKKECCDSIAKKACCDSTNKASEPCCSEKKEEVKAELKTEKELALNTTSNDQTKLDAAEAAYNEMIAVMNAGGNNYDKIQESRKAYQKVKEGLSNDELATHIKIMKAKRQAKIDAAK